MSPRQINQSVRNSVKELFELGNEDSPFVVTNKAAFTRALRIMRWPTHINGDDYTICVSVSTCNILLNVRTGRAVVPTVHHQRFEELKSLYHDILSVMHEVAAAERCRYARGGV
jgi:hypothetical protein